MQTTFGEFYEDLNDALRDVVRQLGGNKRVGALLRPELPLAQAENWMRDCLNPDRREKLSPEQVVLLLVEASKAGAHGCMSFLAMQCGYETPRPVRPEDQEAALQTKFIDAVEQLQGIQQQLARVQSLRRVG